VIFIGYSKITITVHRNKLFMKKKTDNEKEERLLT